MQYLIKMLETYMNYLLIIACVINITGGVIYFQPGLEYRYSVDGTTAIDDVNTFKVESKIGIVALAPAENGTQHCELQVHYYFIYSEAEDTERLVDTTGLDFTKWCSFRITKYGEVNSVLTDESEHPFVLALKKTVLGTLSSKLVVSESHNEKQLRWAYKADEVGHEGNHESTYQAEPNGEIIKFTKQKHTPPMKGATHKFLKNINLNVKRGVLEMAEVDETFATPKKPVPGYKPIVRGTEEELEKGNQAMAMPTMGGNSTIKLVLDKVLKSSSTNKMPVRLTESSLEIGNIPDDDLQLTVAQPWILGNLSIAAEAKFKKDNKKAMPFFHNVTRVLKRLVKDDLLQLTAHMKNISKTRPLQWTIYLNALGATASNLSLEILINETLHSSDVSPGLLMNAMVHFVGLQHCPSQFIKDTFEERVFRNPWWFNDTHQTSLVNERAELILGSLVSSSYKCDQMWATAITRELQSLLGTHDPFNHRIARSALTKSDFKRYVNKKALHMLALGNGRIDSSLEYYQSFLNTSESHLHLRCSAVEAISKYQHMQAAEMLLTAVITDGDETVRNNALIAYEKHPFGGDLSALFHNRANITTSEQHHIMKRSLESVANKIWKGFEFELELPGLNWKKAIGGSMLGASMGIILLNTMEIKISPMSGYAKVNVEDKAWATVHIGLFGFDIDIFRAELCYKGEIHYELNILAEFGFGDLAEYAAKYGKIIQSVINTIKTAIEGFKSLVTMWSDFDIGELFDRFIAAIKDMPKTVLDVKKIGRKIFRILADYVDLPPIVEMIRDLVVYVNTLFSDIKEDIMTFYNSIVDTISTTLPWAWNEIIESFHGIVEAFKKIIRNPQQSMQTIARGIARITAAVGVVLEAKNKIQEANIFDKDQRPYWFDLSTVIDNLFSQIQEITDAIGSIGDSITIDDSENSEALAFTGIDLKTMILNILKEIWQKIKAEFESGPMEVVREVLVPFQTTYDFFIKTVKNIKEAWVLITNGYRSAKTELQLIFGFKFDKNFPRKYLESATCGEGFWKSNGKDNYVHPGVDIDANGTDTVVAPANGYIWKSGRNQVSILVEDVDETMIILENIALTDGLNGTEVAGGSVIGTLTQPYWCSDKHIHLSMKKTTGNDYIDPSKYMEKRKMPRPGWIEHCDIYIMIWKTDVVSQGSVTYDPVEDDETPSVDNAPSAIELEVAEIPSSSAGKRRKKRFLNEWIDNLQGFAQSLGLPSLDTIKDVFTLNMNNITITNLLNFMDQYGMTEMKAKIESYIKKIQEFGESNTCQTPASLTLEELKRSLIIAGKSADGDRKTLEKRYSESDNECFGIRNTLGKESICQFSPNCLSVSCCINLKFFKIQKSLSGFITLDPCSQEITFGIESWQTTVTIGDVAIENTLVISADTQLLDIAQLLVYYKMQKDGNNIKVSFGVTFCSTFADVCMDMFMIAEDAQFIQAECTNNDENAVSSRKKRQLDELQELLQMNVGDFLKNIDILGLDEEDVNELMQSITDAFQEWLLNQIQTAVASIFGDEFESFDVCMKGRDLWFGPYELVIYESPPYIIPLGPIPCVFMWGISGYYGATYKYDLCLLSMKATGQVTPIIGSVVWGQFGIDLNAGWIRFTAVVRLTGYLLTTSFPTKAEVGFSKFPLDVKGRMDMVLVPLRIELRVILRLTVRIKIWGKTFSKTWTLINALLWKYQTKSIKANIFNINDAEPDDSPPSFEIFTKTPVSVSRMKRSGISECTVYQIPGKDYTEPEFFLATSVTDDRSEVKSTYCVGTFPGGCDVINNESFGGDSIVQRRSLYSGAPLYFTITATNSAGRFAKTTCKLPTFDVTLPGGRVTADFTTTSHPYIVRALVVIVDDTPIVNRAICVGFGISEYGCQLVQWQNFAAEADDRGSEQAINNPAGIHLLDHFANPRQGRLGLSPFSTTRYDFPQGCAKDCLAHPGTKCMSFNYDYGPVGTCELLEMIEGHVSLHHSGSFYHFERYGIAQTQSFHFDVEMEHNTLAFFNMYLENQLVFKRFQHGSGILVDLTPPHPGPISNALIDETLHEECLSYTPAHLSQRCMEPTPVANYRFITDGPESGAVFNGHERLVDLLYTRANTFASANWDGFGDNETSILIYTWAIGTEPCGFNIHPHRDPHAHIAFASEWTHMGLAHPLTLDDDEYHVTVRALNDVDFGGPMAVTVCHSTPYIVDTTDPVIVKVHQAEYNESHFITMHVEAYDALSGLKRGELSLGYTKRDTYEMIWTEVEDFFNITFQRQLPDGKPVWVKVQVTDNVNLRASSHSPKPIFIDESPPLEGEIFHGGRNGEHMQYQWDTSTLCVNWDGFYDPDSGISLYNISAGSLPGLADIAETIELPGDVYDYCLEGLNLQHNTMYYVNLLAENGATLAKNVTASSPGVLVDTSAPLIGRAFVYDEINHDILFSSSSTTVKTSWGNFTDPESGLKKTDVIFYRTSAGTEAMVDVHSNLNLTPNISSLEQHHFHFRHKDVVHIKVTETNNALLSSSVQSNGYLVDLTEPELIYLFDGYGGSSDTQFISENMLSATWNYEDDESGIDGFEFTAFSVRGGRKEKIYPTSEDYVELPASTTTHRTGPLNLIPGGFYFSRTVAINNAGLTAIHDTDGVVVDFSPPEMSYVNAGVLSGSERVIDGTVLINDRSNLFGSWKGFDLESGIVEYIVGVGSSPGIDDVLPYSSLGISDNGRLTGMSLELTSTETGVPVYYINVYASNGAGSNSSVMNSSPIKVVDEDKEGVIWDGSGESYHDDIDTQLDRSTVTIGFSGFESALHGIAYYEWAIGTQPRIDDSMPYTDEGIIVEDGNLLGMGSDGIAQMQVSLDIDVKYYVSIRAITGAGNILDYTSDGIIVDHTDPSIEINKFGLSEIPDLKDVIYQRSSDIVEFKATANDTDGLIVNSVTTASNIPAEYHNLQLSDQGEPELIITKQFHPNDNGIANYVTVTVQNSLGLTKTIHSSPLVVDDSPPLEGYLICPEIISGGMITCEWDNFIDIETGIAQYMIGFGISEGDTSIINFREIDHDEYSITLRPEDGLDSLLHNEKYFMTIKAINNVHLETTVFSSPIQVDTTPATTGWLIELEDYTLWDSTTGHEFAVDLNQEIDVICQRDLTQIRTAWQSFVDEESLIAYYEIGVGSTPGGTQIQSFVHVESEVNNYLFRNLDLYHVREAFVILKGFNNAGLSSTVISNGVFISRISAGFPPLRELQVIDGPYSFDIDHQNNRDTISASWDLYGDPCPVVKYEWGVERFDGKVILNMTEVSADQTYANADEIELYDKEFYFVKLKAINVMGYVTIIHSDGIEVKVEPLLPGVVRDGPVLGVDIKSQTSESTICANWNGFGQERTDGTFSDMYAYSEEDIDDSQAILNYEVAVGTDRRYPNKRNNVHHYINVGLNKTWTFNNLELSGPGSTYYVTVRAHSVSTAMTEVTSNGVQIRDASEAALVEIGEINIQRYIASASSLVFDWTSFEFLSPVIRYYWGVKSGTDGLSGTTCNDMITSTSGIQNIFDVYSLTAVGLDTYVLCDQVLFNQGESYTVYVVAVDEFGLCAMTSKLFTVDVTHPEEGSITVGVETRGDLMFTPDHDTLTAHWSEYKDSESGLKQFKIKLMTSEDCGSSTVQQLTQLSEEITIHGSYTNYTFIEVNIERNIPYFLVLETENNAGLIITTVSRPILADFADPISGRVVDGLVFEHDVAYQSSDNSIAGTMLYTPPGNLEPCPFTRFDSYKLETDLTKIVHKGMWTLPHSQNDNIMFLESQVAISEESEIILTLQKDIASENMLAGAVMVDSDVQNSASYEFDIKPANELNAVTSVTLWDGPQGIYVSHHTISTPIPSVASNIDDEAGIVQGIPDPLAGDTLPSEYSSTRENGNGFGFQISTDTNGTLITLWAYNQQETRYVDNIYSSTDLNSQNWHTFKLVINDEDEDVKMHDWVIKLLINGKLMGEVAGITGVNPGSKLLIGIHRNDDEESIVITDRFQPPSSRSLIKIKRFPPASSELCRHGLPFQATDHDILEFTVAIGSEKGFHDIIDFQTVNAPCIPCQTTGCSTLMCDQQCEFDTVQVIQFHLENVQLPDKEIAPGISNSSALLKQYYITVKGLTGSGREALASSNGFYIDKTPPNIHKIYHLDPNWSSSEPVIFQGDNSTISAYWEADDNDCDVIDFKWGIGTSPGGLDIQPLKSVGTELIAFNDTLTLEDNTTYFVTVSATNEAGLTSQNFSAGVTVVLTPPTFDGEAEAASAVGTEPIGVSTRRKSISNTAVNTVKTYLQDELTCQWTVPSNQNIDSIFGGVGTNTNSMDILSEVQVAWNNSGSFTINHFGLSLDGGNETTVANLSDVASPDEPNSNMQTGFLLERGRSMVCNLRACNKGHVCSSMPTKNIIIVAELDIIQPPDDDGFIRIETTSLEFEYEVNLHTAMVQNADQYIVLGLLSPSELEEEYISAASTHFISFIANPATTYFNTERVLYQRFSSYKNISFYITALPEQSVTGPVELVAAFSESVLNHNGNEVLKLLSWCYERDMWIDAANTCNDYQSFVNLTDNTIRVRVCSIDNYCDSLPEDNTEGRRKRRAVEPQDGLTTARSFIVAGIETDTVNYPPYLVSDTAYHMYEDAGTVELTLSAVDPEEDQFDFILNTTVYVSNGTVSLSPDGLLSYKPCQDCFGMDSIHFNIIERNLNGMDSLSTSIMLTFEILPLNDNPEILVINEGRSLPVIDTTVTLIVDNNSPSQEPYAGLLIMLSSFDVDGDGLNLYYDAPENGVFEIKTQRQTIDFIDINCDLFWIDMYDIWEAEFSKFESHQPFAMPIPCDVGRNLTVNEINWMLASVLYTPRPDYIGPDSIKVYAADEHGTPSQLLTINIYVLEDPCWNNATCNKPVTDETCTSIDRSSGFDGYYCICAPGFTGVYCETNIDECASQPCDKDYVCIDEIANFTCVCEEGKDCLHTGLYSWQISIIVLVIAALAIVFGVIIVWCMCCKNNKIGCMSQPKDPHPKYKYQLDSSSRPTSANTASRPTSAKSTTVDVNAKQWVVHSPRAPLTTNYEDYLRKRQPKMTSENDKKISVDEQHLRSSFDNESTPITASGGGTINVDSSHIEEAMVKTVIKSSQKRKFHLASSPEPAKKDFPTADEIDDDNSFSESEDDEEINDANKAVFDPKWKEIFTVSSDGKRLKVKKKKKRGRKAKQLAQQDDNEVPLKELSGIYGGKASVK